MYNVVPLSIRKICVNNLSIYFVGKIYIDTMMRRIFKFVMVARFENLWTIKKRVCEYPYVVVNVCAVSIWKIDQSIFIAEFSPSYQLKVSGNPSQGKQVNKNEEKNC